MGDGQLAAMEAAREEMATGGMSARIAAEARMKQAAVMAGVYFAASMAHSNLTLMGGDDPIEVNYVFTPDADKALDADG